VLASFIGVSYTILLAGFLGGWDQLDQPDFWVGRGCLFAGGFLGFVLVFHVLQSHRAKQGQERNHEAGG
jgi:hypothetical protein